MLGYEGKWKAVERMLDNENPTKGRLNRLCPDSSDQASPPNLNLTSVSRSYSIIASDIPVSNGLMILSLE